MSKLNKLQVAIGALDAFYSDTGVELEETLDGLERLEELIGEYICAIEADLRRARDEER